MILTVKVNLFSRVNAVSGSQKVVGHQNKHFKWKCLYEEKLIVNIFQTFFEQLVKQLLSEQAELKGGRQRFSCGILKLWRFSLWLELKRQRDDLSTKLTYYT